MSNQPPIEAPQGAIRLNTDSQKLEFFAQDRWYEFATDSPILDGGARGLIGGGSSPTIRDTIDFVTIASAGDAIDFGNLVAARKSLAGTSDNTRGIFAGGYIAPATTNVMNFVTIATTGDAADFGDLSTARRDTAGFSDSHGGLS